MNECIIRKLIFYISNNFKLKLCFLNKFYFVIIYKYYHLYLFIYIVV